MSENSPAPYVHDPGHCAYSPLDEAAAEDLIHGICFKTGPPRTLGAELEWLVLDAERPWLPLPPERLTAAHAAARALPLGSRVTVEPGGQLELSSAPAPSLTACVEGLRADLTAVRGALRERGLVLRGLGEDPRRPLHRLLASPRYDAMEAYFDRTGPAGRAMMRASASVQVCVDAGHEEPGPLGYGRRWRFAHLLGAVLVAAFANSPGRDGPYEGWRCARQGIWSDIDPRRALAPPLDAEPRAGWVRHALDTEVMCVRRPGDGPWTVPRGLTFRDWLRTDGAGAGPDGRRPTAEDLEYHLTTLFPPVRPRGHLELRMIDAQPGDDGWIVPVAVVHALFDDPEAAETAYRAVKVLADAHGPRRAPRNPLWRSAARGALADPDLRAAATTCFDAAAEALPRLGADAYVQEAVAAFTARYVRRGRCPADDADDVLVSGRTRAAVRGAPAAVEDTAPAAPRRPAARREGTAPVTTETPADIRPGALRERAAAALAAARARTAGLTDVVGDPDLTAQHSPLMSPLVWDLAHIGNQEELWLLRNVAGRAFMRPEINSLYDAFQHPRAERPKLPLLGPEEARRYAAEVRGRVFDLLERTPLEGTALLERGFVFGMVAQHEQQHDETMLITHQLRAGAPVLAAPDPAPPQGPPPEAPEVLVPGGPFTMGTSAEPWALDNERPAHVREVAAFWIDTLPVTNAAYQAFIADGGYTDPRWWAAEGWEQIRAHDIGAPLFWRREAGQWLRRRFGVTEPVPHEEPVLHVSWYEADAYARWAGRRLPTEAEWEKAARHDPVTGRSRRYPWGDADPAPEHANLGQRHLRPARAGCYPAGASPLGVRQLIGDVWEWTASDFLPYPGFRAFPYREYSEVFFGPEHKVLRGGSFAVDPVACRGTFRNWDLPVRRQIFSGFRTARDV